MIKNFITIAYRNLKRFKGYTLINLLGLSLGLTVAVLILLYVTDEIGFDKFHVNKKRIYKVVTANTDGSFMETNAWPVATILKNDFPEVEKVIYTKKAPSNMMVNYEGKRYQQNTHFASDDFFDVFSFEFIEGQPSNALLKPFDLVITETIRDKYFGSELVVGKQLVMADTLEFTITGVISDVSLQSHMQFDMIASFKSYEKLTDWFSYSEGWGNFDVRNYLLVKEGVDVNGLITKSKSIYRDHVGDWLKEMGVDFDVNLVPLEEVYFKPNLGNGFGPHGSIDKIYLVSGIAIFVLLLACINFINLTTARSIYRAKEVGLRKIVGSSKSYLIGQFMTEAFFLTFLSFLFAIILIDISLPFFNQLMGKVYDLASLFSVTIVFGSLVLLFLVTLFSGFYPAYVLSRYKPVDVIKGRMQNSGKGINLRRGLVIFQFFVSTSLLLATLMVLDQLDYMRNQDLGFDKEQVLVLDVTRVPKSESLGGFQHMLTTLSSVENVSFSNALPGRPGWQGQWAYPEEISDGDHVDTEYMAIDENYIPTLGLELVAGVNFDVQKNMSDALIINETTVKEMGWETPRNAIGKRIVSPSKHPEGTVIGVIKDYHGLGLKYMIWPKVMDYAASSYGRYLAVRFVTGSTSDLLSQCQQMWKESFGDSTFEYFFLDDDFDQQYKSEDSLMKVFIVFAVLAIIIAAIGLLGLVSFMVLSKKREIGIRKVLGANSISLASLLSREFIILIIISNLLTVPVIWHFGQQWLSKFAFHTSINPVIFLISTITTLLVAMVTVSIQTIKASIMNPVDSLKSD